MPDSVSRPSATFRLPSFSPDEAELWLVQVKCAFAVANITDDADKFRLLVANLPVHVAAQVRDVVTAEPPSYDNLEAALKSRLAQSRASRLETLLRDQQLGDQRPTQLLRKMQHMLGSSGSDSGLLRTLFLQRLPHTTRAALALLPESTDVDALASAADRFHEASHGATVAAALAPPADDAAPACACRQETPNSELIAAVSALTAAVSRIEASFQRSNVESRHRSKSRSRRPTPSSSRRARKPPAIDDDDDAGYCWYHRKFGAEAQRCNPPCSWQAGN